MRNVKQIIGCVVVILASSLAQAQLYVRNAPLYIHSAAVAVEGDLVIDSGAEVQLDEKTDLSVEGTLRSVGELIVDDSSQVDAGSVNLQAGSTTVHNGYILSNGTWTSVGEYQMSDDALVELSNSPERSSSLEVVKEHLYTNLEVNAVEDIDLQGFLSVRHLFLNEGIIESLDEGDTLLVVFGGTVDGGSKDSYIEGALHRVGEGDLFFPIGSRDGYAPLELIDVPAILAGDTSIIAAESQDVEDFSLNGGIEVQELSQSKYWYIDSYGGTERKGLINLYFDKEKVSTDTPAEQLYPARSNTPNLSGEFDSWGKSSSGKDEDLGMNFVTSAYEATYGRYYALAGGCSNLKTSVNVLLEGARRDASTYQADNLKNTVLDARFEDGGIATHTMYEGFETPTSPNAIDVVTVYLRENTFPFGYVDSTLAWATSDGTLYDFYTGTTPYIHFCDAQSATPYLVHINHRNHLPIMCGVSEAQNLTEELPSSIQFDLTRASNVYGFGGYKLLDGKAWMITGEVSGNEHEISAFDLFTVIKKVKQLPASGYHTEDVNLDGNVDVLDYNIEAPNSLNLYNSSVPPMVLNNNIN